jgi:hypothetical protein
MRVGKYHPGMMVLAGISVLAHVEPADAAGGGCAASQHEDRSERGGSYHLGDTLSRDALKAHQQRELALHGGAERERLAQKL